MSTASIFDAAIFAQSHLDEALPLVRLAGVANLSPHHFHREFSRHTGETPGAYVQRLRLEQAAYRLLLHRDPIISIAFDCGYRNHETLSRAFRRHFGLSPRAYRQRQQFAQAGERARIEVAETPLSYELSATRIAQLQALPIAYIRSHGPYEQVDTGLWDRLKVWAVTRGLPAERLLIGIGHDAPGITALEQLRFDACITVPEGTEGDNQVRIGALPALTFAVTSHVGAYASLPAAYPDIFARSAGMQGYEIIGLPAVEIYRDTSVDGLRAISCTDIYLPVRRNPGTRTS